MKKSKICYILLTIMFSYGCHSCTSNESEKIRISYDYINDSLVYDFINIVVNDTSELNFVVRGDRVLDQPNIIYDDFLIDSLKTLEDFSSEDITFIEHQLEAAKFFKIDSSLFFGKKIISNNSIKINSDNLVIIDTNSLEKRWTFWEDYRKKFGNAGYCILLKPLFSIDHMSVIIRMSYHCGGNCGEGGVFIYKRINNKWMKIKEINRWIN